MNALEGYLKRFKAAMDSIPALWKKNFVTVDRCDSVADTPEYQALVNVDAKEYPVISYGGIWIADKIPTPEVLARFANEFLDRLVIQGYVRDEWVHTPNDPYFTNMLLDTQA